MKKTITLLFCAAIISIVCSCEKKSEGLTRTTYYASITLQGGDEIIVDKGSEYKDPGYYAEMKGEDITDQVQVTSNVDTKVSGIYSIVYSAINEDGFPSSATRTVYVLDPNDPIEGFYTTLEVSANGSTKYNGPWTTLILSLGNSKYSTTDYFGGWYAQGRGYGSTYAMTGEFTINGSDVAYNKSYIAGWGDSLDNTPGEVIGSYSPSEGNLEWTLSYAGSMTFKVKISKDMI